MDTPEVVHLRTTIAFGQQDAASKRYQLFKQNYDLLKEWEGPSRVYRIQAALMERCTLWAGARAGNLRAMATLRGGQNFPG